MNCRAQPEEIKPLSKVCILPNNERSKREASSIKLLSPISCFAKFAVAKNGTTLSYDYRNGLMRREDIKGALVWLMHLTQAAFGI